MRKKTTREPDLMGEKWVDDMLADAGDAELECLAMLSNRPASALEQTNPSKSIAPDDFNPTREWQADYLRSLARHGWKGGACRILNISRRTVDECIAADPLFAAACIRAKEEHVELLEAAANERALNGSDRLLEFMLKAHRPDVYREAGVQISIHSGPIIVDITGGADSASPLPTLEALASPLPTLDAHTQASMDATNARHDDHDDEPF